MYTIMKSMSIFLLQIQYSISIVQCGKWRWDQSPSKSNQIRSTWIEFRWTVSKSPLLCLTLTTFMCVLVHVPFYVLKSKKSMKRDLELTTFIFRPIGLPVMRKVRVFNLNTQSSIQMLSISGNTIHFHCSFFTDKVFNNGFRPDLSYRDTFSDAQFLEEFYLFRNLLSSVENSHFLLFP